MIVKEDEMEEETEARIEDYMRGVAQAEDCRVVLDTSADVSVLPMALRKLDSTVKEERVKRRARERHR